MRRQLSLGLYRFMPDILRFTPLATFLLVLLHAEF